MNFTQISRLRCFASILLHPRRSHKSPHVFSEPFEASVAGTASGAGTDGRGVAFEGTTSGEADLAAVSILAASRAASSWPSEWKKSDGDKAAILPGEDAELFAEDQSGTSARFLTTIHCSASNSGSCGH